MLILIHYSHIKLNDTKEAMELTRTSKGDALKVMVYPNGFLDK